MKSKTFLPLVLALFTVSIASPVRAEPSADAQIQRGKYLVERVAMCADCHTARDWKGKLDQDHWLEGAKLGFKPTGIGPWAGAAPAIAGLPGFTNDEQAVKYFETGINGVGKASRPPMPQFRLEHEDAVAVVAYLHSLKPLSPK
jgi:mono/diheme cytochrome c family protein